MASGSSGNFQSIPALKPDLVPIPTTRGSVNMYMNLDDNLNIWTVDFFKVHRPVGSSNAIKQVNFTWDFDVDGGAVGNFPTGLSIPTGALILTSVIQCFAEMEDGGTFLGNYHIGYIGALDALDFTGNQFFGQGAGQTPDIYGAGNPWRAPHLKLSTGAEIIFSIETVPFTAGKFTTFIYYQEVP